jgi:asparagine synthase (glutamine-hydrolysing)
MCGIAGFVDLSGRPIDVGVVSQMCDAMARRGPDASGVKVLPYAALGHRRLAILDLSDAGNQPMVSADGSLWVVFNGEIYNHRELRSELETLRASYRTRTDTETLLNGFQTWSEGLSVRCRGMWAFAIWDVAAQTLYLSRDRLGEKPLFYYQEGSSLAFASTLAGLRPALPRCVLNPEAVASLLGYEYVPHTESIYQGVHKLPPAHYLTFDRTGLRVVPYWKLDYRQKLAVSLPEAERLVEDTLESAVQEQLAADVPVGVFLSGGVDSGYVAALAARRKPGIVSITMAVPGSVDRDESANARQIARTHHTTHLEVPLDQSCIRDLPALLATSEPLGDSSIIPAAAVAGQAARSLKVVLTGDGGDEGFDGYGKPRAAVRAQFLARTRVRLIWRLLAPFMLYLSQHRLTPVVRLLRLHSSGAGLMAGSGLEAFLSAWEATAPQVRRLLYGPRLRSTLGRPSGEYLIDALHQSLHNDWWEALLSVGIKTRLVDDFLFKVDTATMFHSLEARAPLLDHRLIELSARLPLEVLMPDEHSKGLLKRLAARHNPAEVVYGPKKGFSLPVERYFLGGWGKILLELTRDGVAAQLGLLDPDGVRRYLNAHGLRASYRLDRQLFSILVLELWLRVFHVRSESAEELGDRLLRSLYSANG